MRLYFGGVIALGLILEAIATLNPERDRQTYQRKMGERSPPSTLNAIAIHVKEK